MINVGIIGSGKIVPSFITATQKAGGYRYAAIASPNNVTSLENFKQQYDMDYWTQDNEKIFNDPDINAIYVAVPNGLHYAIAKRALECGKHVIVEKPFTSNYKQAEELVKLAEEKNLIVFEAITLRYLPNYLKIKEVLDTLGEVKMVDINFSQYSSRYDKFKQGIIQPAFDPKMAGGCLMDLGVYSIHFVLGLFGMPKDFKYYANITKGIDTSGTLVMDYGSFKATLVTCKDCKGPLNTCIQTDAGYIRFEDASSVLFDMKVVRNDGSTEEYQLNNNDGVTHLAEYQTFRDMVENNDLEAAARYNKETLKVMKVLDEALASAGLHFE
ncbi:MAG: Gfo/Idh/MocA family oxidoreductase [Erysipelotrichaceae bacterium]|nr:Gfo/Idh/MocA family oxidoreductase [Erysipelotrichaceae bacterium]